MLKSDILRAAAQEKQDELVAPDRVRVADIDDTHCLLDLLAEMHEENGQFPMSRDKVIETLNKVFFDEIGIIGVIGERPLVEASICLMFGEPWYSDQSIIQERWSFVLPKFRHSNNAKDLISFAKWASDILSLPLLMSVVSHKKTEAKVRLFQRQLGTPYGAVFIHNLNGGCT